jgi:hypothetical protein
MIFLLYLFISIGIDLVETNEAWSKNKKKHESPVCCWLIDHRLLKPWTRFWGNATAASGVQRGIPVVQKRCASADLYLYANTPPMQKSTSIHDYTKDVS